MDNKSCYNNTCNNKGNNIGCQFEPYNWLLSCLSGTVEVDLHDMPLPALTKRECGLSILDNRRE